MCFSQTVDPNFYSKNLLLLGKTYLKLQNRKLAAFWLLRARDHPAHTEEDRQVRRPRGPRCGCSEQDLLKTERALVGVAISAQPCWGGAALKGCRGSGTHGRAPRAMSSAHASQVWGDLAPCEHVPHAALLAATHNMCFRFRYRQKPLSCSQASATISDVRDGSTGDIRRCLSAQL